MGTADFSLELTITGNADELYKLLSTFRSYAEGKNGVYFCCSRETITDRNTIAISALGPYGHYCELNDVDVFREMAENAPTASFEAEISGFTSYTEQSLTCVLKEGMLYIETYYEENGAANEAYLEYFQSQLPYDEFINLFKLDSDEFDEDAYVEFVYDLADYDNCITDIEYDTLFDAFGVDSALEEEDFDAVMIMLRSIPIMPFEEFRDTCPVGDERKLCYDPVAKAYI